ncbi:hypothetical protein Dimus_039728 [Dionaea muscipula]
MDAAVPVAFPMEQRHALRADTGPLLSDPGQHHRLIGRLIYLTIMRPDIAYSVHILSQFMQQPRQPHLLAARRLLRYLVRSSTRDLWFSALSPLQVRGYCDSDWVSCPLTRRTVTGYFTSLGSSPLSWKSKKQSTVARSSAEAEYRSLAYATSELIWLRSVIRDLRVPIFAPISLYCDNQAAIYIASNPVFHERIKHIEINCHFIRNHFLRGTISPTYISSQQQPADLLTKALGRDHFHNLLFQFGLIIRLPLEGGITTLPIIY